MIRIIQTLVMLLTLAALVPAGPAVARDSAPDHITRLAAQSCPSGLVPCRPGAWGPGGCYRPGAGSCVKGLICGSGLKQCGPGVWGSGGCYRPGVASCGKGKICPHGLVPCIGPSSKQPGCYQAHLCKGRR